MPSLEQIKNHALSLMQSGGFPITEKVSIAVDEKLPFMGYTTQKDNHPHIVVAKWAKESDMLTGLLIHELSHIYRMETHHPSHNFAIHQKALSQVLGNQTLRAYQEEILHNILNSIQDLYADDIFFSVEKNASNDLAGFFLSWIHQPVTGTSEKRNWVNAGNLVSAAFAKANMQRHHIPDTDGKIEKGVQEFLAHVPKDVATAFAYFTDTMVGLPEKITDEQCGALLVDYLHHFLGLVQTA